MSDYNCTKTIENYLSDSDIFNDQGGIMDNEKPDIKKEIEKFYKLDKKIDHIVASRQNIHTQAHQAGLAKITKDGKINWDSLKTEEGRKKVSEGMAEFYLSKAKQELHINEDHKFEDKGDEKLYNDQILTQYAGLTEKGLNTIIGKIVKEHGVTAFSSSTYSSVTGEHTKSLENNLRGSASDHLSDKDVDYIIKYTKANKEKNLVDSNKMKIEHGVELLREFKNGKGAITETFAKQKDYIHNDLKEKAPEPNYK